MKIQSNPREILVKNIHIISVLLLANILAVLAQFYLTINSESVTGLIRLFDFDRETNVPTLYSSIALLFAGVLLYTIAYNKKQTNSPYILWMLLALIFLFLSIDEISSIHESLIYPVREALGTSGIFFYAWVIPYGIGLLGFVILYTKFLFQLTAKIRVLFVASGAIYVCGALGFELIGGWYADNYGAKVIIYSIITSFEELLEMLGIALFTYALFTYITEESNAMEISIEANLS